MDEETLALSLSLLLEFDFEGQLLGFFTRPKFCGSNRTELCVRVVVVVLVVVLNWYVVRGVDMSSAPDSLLV